MEQIRRMRGGAQSHLMRCSDGRKDDLYYVVKFQNNPQHCRVLVNELLGTRLAARMGLPTPPVAVVEVGEDLIRATPDLCIELPRSRMPCRPGLQFGSGFPGNPRSLTLFDFLPDEQLREVQNIHDFAGMLVFDKWTCNTNGRQTLFFRESGESHAGDSPGGGAGSPGSGYPRSPGYQADAGEGGAAYKTVMIDQGFCFNAGEWNYPDAPLRGLYTRNRVYQGVTGMESFGPWVVRVQNMSDRVLESLAGEVPPEWYEDDHDALLSLLEQLYRRRSRLPDLLLEAKRSSRQPFPNWH
jgi:hypothetical protein